MVLRLPDKWVWDFWFARHEGRYHIFYLQAPRALGDPSRRHHSATIGHALSTDCRDWAVLPDAVHPGPPGSWDDLATWTGSTIEHRGRWYMAYTGISRAERGLVQRVGLAQSDDLANWAKHPANPVIEADPRWYELLSQGRWVNQAWRDPWLFRLPGDHTFHVLITARARSGHPDAAGVLAHARSTDLVDWEVLPPLTSPGEFSQLEVPQLVVLNGRYVILFCCLATDQSRARSARTGARSQGGTFALSAADFAGPYSPGDSPIALSEPLGVLYAGKLLDLADGEWRFMAFRGDGDRDFLGELTDPLPIEVSPAGDIVVRTEATPGERDDELGPP